MKGLSLKKISGFIFTGTALIFSLTGCGGNPGPNSASTDTVSQTSSETNPQDIQPDIHVNVLPPDSGNQKTLQEDMAANFFANKEIYDSFSPALKNQIIKNIGGSGTNGVDGFDGSGSGSTPSDGSSTGSGSSTSGSDPAGSGTSTDGGATSGSGSTSGGGSSSGSQVVTTLLGGSIPILGSADCDPSSSFLCLDSPQDGTETVSAGIDVVGKIDLNQLAVFGPNDPVAVVSVFNNTSGSALNEVPVMPQDVEALQDPNFPDAGRFSVAVGLGGAGNFTIVVSAYKTINDGTDNELASVMVHVIRLGIPEIEFVEAKPSPENFLAEHDHRQDPVEDGAVIASEALEVKVRLTTVSGEGIVTKFEDFDQADHLQFATAMSPQDNGEIVGKVLLHQGLNKIVITARNPALEEQLGDQAPEPSVIRFQVFNAWGGPRLKMISPLSDGLVPENFAGQTVDLKFCYTFVPSHTQSQAGGSLPTLSDDCVTGQLGFVPKVFVNGREIGGKDDPKHDSLTCDTSQGICTAKVTPDFGINLYEISATDVIATEAPQTSQTSSKFSGAFVFGKPVPLFKDGMINQLSNFDNAKNFTPRGLNIDIDRSMIEGDVKEMIIRFLNRPETVDMLLGNFKSRANKPGYVCPEFTDPNTGRPVSSTGETTLNFLTDTFQMGEIELTRLEAGGDGLLHVGVRINGMHGEADLKSAETNGNTFNGMDLAFLPLTISIAKLEINVGVAFPKVQDIDLNNDGKYEERSVLDLRQIEGMDLIKITGDGPMGKVAYVNSTRNPLAAGMEVLDWQQNLIHNTFYTIMGGALLCGVENSLNNESTGVLGMGVTDLEKITGYSKNPFRLPLKFDLLGKSVDLDVAYNLMKGDIDIDRDGIHIRNVPLRFNPGPDQLNQLVEDFKEGIVGAVSRLLPTGEDEPLTNPTNDQFNLGIELSEDAVNQALFAANMAGLLDLDLDANFYTQNKITPVEDLAPMGGGKLTQTLDLNQDGKLDETDKLTPILMRIRTNKNIPPMLTFLTQEEVDRLAQQEEDYFNNSASGTAAATPQPTPQGTPLPTSEDGSNFDPQKKYFKLSAADVELDVFKEEAISSAVGGTRTYCREEWQDSPDLKNKGFFSMTGKVLVDDNDNPSDTPSCDSPDNLVTLPRFNGPIVSYGDPDPGSHENPLPVFRLKVGLVVYGYFKGFNHGTYAKDLLLDPNAPEKTVLHLGFVPKFGMPSAFITSVQVLENNTDQSDEAVADFLNVVITSAIGDKGKVFNEMRIPVPDKFPGDPKAGEEPKDLLPDFGLASVSLMGDANEFPEIFIDDNRLYLDVLMFAGLNFTEDGSGSGNGLSP